MKIALTTILTALLLTPLAVLPAAEQPNFVVIFAGTSTNLMASTMDLLPTFASLAGEPFEPQLPIDGVDISSLFHNPLPRTSPRNTFAYYGYFNAENQTRDTDQVLLHAVREGRWKHYLKPTQFLKVGTEAYLEIQEGALYDLDADPGEMNNIAKNYPEVVTKLKALAKSYVRKLGDEGRPGTDARKAGYVKVAHPMNWQD